MGNLHHQQVGRTIWRGELVRHCSPNSRSSRQAVPRAMVQSLATRHKNRALDTGGADATSLLCCFSHKRAPQEEKLLIEAHMIHGNQGHPRTPGKPRQKLLERNHAAQGRAPLGWRALLAQTIHHHQWPGHVWAPSKRRCMCQRRHQRL